MVMILSSCGSSKGNEWGIGVFLVHFSVYVGVQSLVSHLSFCMCSSSPPFPAVVEDALLHL